MGWIKLNRKITEHWLWQDAERLKWWLDLLFLAAWEEKKILHDSHLLVLRKGQMVASISFLSERWGKSNPTIIKFLKLLEEEGMIYRQTLYRQTPIITICNYEKYQEQEVLQFNSIVDTQVDKQVNSIVDTQVDRNKEYKEYKEYKEERLTDKTSLSVCQFDKQTDLPNVTKNENIDWDEIVLFFNEKVKNKSIPPIKLMTDRRKQAVRARIREYGFEAIKTAIINAAQSEFMNGRNRKNWTATFDWIFLPNNFPKVLEDNYKNKYNTYGTSTEYSGYIAPELRAAQERREQEERLAARIQRLAEEDGGGW